MSIVQLPGSKRSEKNIIIHYCSQNNDVSLDKEFQKHLSNDDHKHRVIDQGKDRQIASKRKWTGVEYHVQDNADVSHKYVKMYCDTNQFLALLLCGSYPKPHRTRGLGKHYHVLFDTNIGHGICAILRIPCACVACTSILDQPWISGVQSTKQARYQPVINCTYWTVLGLYNNCNIIQLTPKSIPSEAFYEIHQVVIYRIVKICPH